MNNRYCAFLRGVNVKGTRMKMAEVCALFERIGMNDVSSVLASGNIIFSSEKDASQLKNILEAALSGHFNYEAFLFLRNKNEVQALIQNNPYLSEPNFHIYGFICNHGIEKTLQSEFDNAQTSEGEEGRIVAGNFYWKVEKGNTLGTEFGKILGRNTLKNVLTSRNMNTIEKVLKKM